MKKLANLKGAKALNREQQKSIFGGETDILTEYPGGGGGNNCHYYLSGEGAGVLCTGNTTGCFYTCSGDATFHGCVDSMTECTGR